MGFCTTRNPYTGREVLVCDFCSSYPARKVRCPYNYCQAWACCAGCRKAGKARASSCGNGTHREICLPRHIEHVKDQERDAAVVASGAFVRRAALNQNVSLGVQVVRVLFRDGTGAERFYEMSDATYHAIDYGVPATPEDYAKHGSVHLVECADLYAASVPA